MTAGYFFPLEKKAGGRGQERQRKFKYTRIVTESQSSLLIKKAYLRPLRLA